MAIRVGRFMPITALSVVSGEAALSKLALTAS